VDDGAWHHARLTSSGSSQTLYIDNQAGVTISGTINLTTQGQQLSFGAGYLGGHWPTEPYNLKTATADYFNGDIAAITLS
jgi:large repetitive protein